MNVYYHRSIVAVKDVLKWELDRAQRRVSNLEAIESLTEEELAERLQDLELCGDIAKEKPNT